VTLLRLGLGFLAVAGAFIGFNWASGDRGRRAGVVAAAEALVLTLLGALWFGSLGRGGWVSVFLLVGLLASGTDRWLPAPDRGPSPKLRVRATLVTAMRYVVAGALLALLVG